MSRQTTGNFVTLHAAVNSLPFPASKSDTNFGNSIVSLLDAGGRGSGKLEFWIEADGAETLTNVRAWLYEDEWGALAQAGASDRLFDSITLSAAYPVRVVVADAGRPTRAGISATIAGSAMITVRVRRLDDL